MAPNATGGPATIAGTGGGAWAITPAHPDHAALSTTMAMPWPPPMHRAARPSFASRRPIS